jgi:hypothetical protein
MYVCLSVLYVGDAQTVGVSLTNLDFVALHYFIAGYKDTVPKLPLGANGMMART